MCRDQICGYNVSVINYSALKSSLVVQWLGLGAFTAVALGSIPDRATEIPQATWCGREKKVIKRETSQLTLTT